MRATGIVRRVDELGRIVIPKEIRKSLYLKEGDAMELFVEDDGFCYKKYRPLERILSNICAALLNAKKEFAVYSICDRVGGNARELPRSIPETWTDHLFPFYDNGWFVIPLVSGDDILGYIAIAGTDSDEYAKGVAAMTLAMF